MPFAPSIPWLEHTGPVSDVVASCRVRIARNIAGFPFVSRASPTQLAELVVLLRSVLLDEDVETSMKWIDLDTSPALTRRLLAERHLISRQHADQQFSRAVAISPDETLSVMVNEEDHLRVQVLGPGLQLDRLHARLDELDDRIERRVDYAFHRRWGYLTACPTNVGTGIRFSAMMHLPAVRMTKDIDKVKRAAKDLHLAVRGSYGEGSESAGDFYQVSNQVTLGRSEAELAREFCDVVLPRLIQYERESRRTIMAREPVRLDDRVHRALGLLRTARLIDAEEAIKLLSRVRLGVCLGRLEGEGVDLTTIARLSVRVQPAHVQTMAGGEQTTEEASEEASEVRATMIRQALGA